MEPKFQTSFIPKGPIVAATSKPAVKPAEVSVSFLPSIATVIFIIALLAWGGLWTYGHYLSSQVMMADQTLVSDEQSLDPQTTNTLLAASARIQAAGELVKNHVAASNLFILLQQNVLPNVNLTDFALSGEPDGSLDVTMSGTAPSYTVLAEQSQIFNNLPYMSNISFNDLVLSNTGIITWKFSATLSGQAVTYLAATSANVPAVSIPTASPSATTTATTTAP